MVRVFDARQADDLLDREETGTLFLGYVYGSVSSARGYAGVSGARNVSRLRSLLL